VILVIRRVIIRGGRVEVRILWRLGCCGGLDTVEH